MMENQDRLLFALCIIMLLLGIGMVFYHNTENWSWTDSFYFTAVSVTTVGYGDIYPKTHVGRLFTAFYVLLAVPMVYFSLILFAETYFHRHFSRIQGANLKAIAAISKVGSITKIPKRIIAGNQFLKRYKDELEGIDREMGQIGSQKPKKAGKARRSAK